MTEYKDVFPTVNTEKGKQELKKMERMFLFFILFRDSEQMLDNADFNVEWIDQLECEHTEIGKLFTLKYRNTEFEKSEQEREKRLIREWLKNRQFQCMRCYFRQKRDSRYFDCWGWCEYNLK